ncbi:response regulator [Actinospongicola halichondriae]|uniref:response regulator n=1 Tax=Actinospongicola halichondriae TaxID=3236844 RepID=UPI003D3BE5EB
MDDDSKLGPVARRLAATKRVLCIEDEHDIASFLRAYFRAAGYDLVHVDPDDVDAAVHAVEEHQPDVVLLDLRLRGYSGRDVYRRLRADESNVFMPVILVSADAMPTLRSSKGLDAFVSKPFNTNTLADIVRDRLEIARDLAATGRHERLPLLTQRYLEARLADEIAVAGTTGQFTFGLVRLVNAPDIVIEVGSEGLEHLIDVLVGRVRDRLPDEAVTGLSDAGEAAVILPTHDADATAQLLTGIMDDVSGQFEFPGGASVPIRLAGGIAAFPKNAGSPDELFMAADAALADAVDRGSVLARAL